MKLSDIEKSNIKRYEEVLFRMAEYPSEKELKGMTLYGVSIVKFSKKALIYFIIKLVKRQEDDIKEHHRQLKFITSLRRR